MVECVNFWRISTLLKVIQNIEKGYLPNTFMRSELPWYGNQAKMTQENKIRGQYLWWTQCKNLKQNISKLNATTHWKHYSPQSWGVYSSDGRRVTIYEWVHMISHMNKMKYKNHQPPFLMSQQSRGFIEQIYFNIIKILDDKPT